MARSGRLTYRQLDELAEQHVHALIAAGVRPGDRLGVSLINDLPIVALFHAAMRLGVIWVGINQALAPPEKAYLLADSQAAFFAGDEAMVEQVQGAQAAHEVKRYLTVDVAPGSEWSSLLAEEPSWTPPVPDSLAPAAIAYTSGTTGFPKGAVHSQHNLMVPGSMVIRARDFGPNLIKADCFPLTILNMQVLSTLLVPQCGGTALVMDRVDPLGIAEWIDQEYATVWNGAPAMLFSLATNDEVAPESLRTLQDVWSGGSHCPQATKDRFTKKFGLAASSTYGQTEVPTLVAIVPVGEQVDATVSGLPLPHLALHIVDDSDAEVPVGTSGEICIGPSNDPDVSSLYHLMLGYWRNEAASARTLRNGLLHTGDEVERIIDEFPHIAASCVVCVPDDRLGARVAAVVELEGSEQREAALDADALRAYCRANLARYKVPEVFLVRTLPRNAMGKVILGEVGRWVEDLDLDAPRTPTKG